jgi:hypothetical protein
MIWLSVNRDFFISVDPFRWKKFYFSALRIFGGITVAALAFLDRLRDGARLSTALVDQPSLSL